VPRTAPLYRRRIVLLQPGESRPGPTGERMPGPETRHEVRAERRDLPFKERVESGVSLDEEVTRFFVRRGDVGPMPTAAWKMIDDRDEMYDVRSVIVQDGRRDDDPFAPLELLCLTSKGVA